MRLSHRDYEALLHAIHELHAEPDLEEFWRAVPGIFSKLIPAEHFGLVGYNIDPAARRATVTEVRDNSSPPIATRQVKATMERLFFSHPFAQYSVRTADPTALIISDFMSDAAFRDSPVYREFHQPLGWDRLLSVGVSSRISNLAAINVLRKGRDFTERDRLIMNLIQPHVDLACRNAERATSLAIAVARPLASYDLSPREIEAARWLAQGKTNPEIAIILEASVRTVEKHVAKIIEKLGAENRTVAALMVANSPGSVDPISPNAFPNIGLWSSRRAA